MSHIREKTIAGLKTRIDHLVRGALTRLARHVGSLQNEIRMKMRGSTLQAAVRSLDFFCQSVALAWA
jgi:hypothetical protein